MKNLRDETHLLAFCWAYALRGPGELGNPVMAEQFGIALEEFSSRGSDNFGCRLISRLLLRALDDEHSPIVRIQSENSENSFENNNDGERKEQKQNAFYIMDHITDFQKIEPWLKRKCWWRQKESNGPSAEIAIFWLEMFCKKEFAKQCGKENARLTKLLKNMAPFLRRFVLERLALTTLNNKSKHFHEKILKVFDVFETNFEDTKNGSSSNSKNNSLKQWFDFYTNTNDNENFNQPAHKKKKTNDGEAQAQDIIPATFSLQNLENKIKNLFPLDLPDVVTAIGSKFCQKTFSVVPCVQNSRSKIFDANDRQRSNKERVSCGNFLSESCDEEEEDFENEAEDQVGAEEENEKQLPILLCDSESKQNLKEDEVVSPSNSVDSRDDPQFWTRVVPFAN